MKGKFELGDLVLCELRIIGQIPFTIGEIKGMKIVDGAIVYTVSRFGQLPDPISDRQRSGMRSLAEDQLMKIENKELLEQLRVFRNLEMDKREIEDEIRRLTEKMKKALCRLKRRPR